MSKNTDEALSSPTPAPREDDSIEESPLAADPETFEVGAMIAGVRYTRLRVKVQPNGHLLERLQEMADEIDSYATDDEVPDELAEEWFDTKDQFDHVDVFVVEGRNSDWVRQFESDMKAEGVNPKRKGLSDAEVHKQMKQLVQAQIAAQIVSPEGVTPADMEALFTQSEVEGDKLYRAMRQVNTQPASMVTPDFSQRVSRLSRRG